MHWKSFFTISVLSLIVAPCNARPAIKAAESIDFNRDVRPILSDKCLFCHGPDAQERQADLRFDEEDSALRDRGGYAVIVPGEASRSEIMNRILSNEPQLLMPPPDSHKHLNENEISILRQWIEQGAQYNDPWAYVAPRPVATPQVKHEEWARNWIDHFLLRGMEARGVLPAEDADKSTLLRRVHFDLIGLPPSSSFVASFIRDQRDFELVWREVVDDLIASPHFGERMAMYWLDLVRFADTCGYHGDQDHNIWPYRDYVIRSFNKNVPFDQFTREQLAGDLVDVPTKWTKVASGYNRLLQTSHEGGVQLKEYDAIYTADRVRNISTVWLGATVGCAQCHDHKYDPFTIEDFYSLGAFFADIHDRGFKGNALPTSRPPEMTFFTDEQDEERKRIEEQMYVHASRETCDLAEKNLERQEKAQALLSSLRVKVSSLLRGEKARDGEKDTAASDQNPSIFECQQKLISAEKDRDALVREFRAMFSSDQSRQRFLNLLERRNDLDAQATLTMVTEAKEPREMRVLPRGNWLDESGAVVSAAVPHFLGTVPVHDGKRPNRLDLANWLTRTDSGIGALTARVFVNRFWYLLFGEGLSRSLDDFGGQGSPPSNLALLDQLAILFYENGWDVKSVLRTIVMSRAYRMSSTPTQLQLRADPQNRLFSRQSRYRLPAECIRDNALYVSGLLNLQIGGASVKPYQPKGYYQHLNFPVRTYKPHTDGRQFRRGLYVHWQRQFLHPMLKALDAPSREECTAARARSNSPTAALVLLNDPTFIEAARGLAERILSSDAQSTRERIEYAFEVVLSRKPDQYEMATCEELLASSYRDADRTSAQKTITIGISDPDKHLDEKDTAVWMSLTRTLLNLDESITRN